MCEVNMLDPANECRVPLQRHRPSGYTYRMATISQTDDPLARLAETMPQTEDDVRRIIKDNKIEFLFAQFVDMHGKPSAKLVPAHHIDDLLSDGAGFAGFAAGDIGQGPHDHDLIAMPDPRSLSILPWQPN